MASSENSDVAARLRAARQIAETCCRVAQFAGLEFASPEAHKLAAKDFDGFRQHVENLFSRWDATLQELDATIDGELWERLIFASRDLGPMVFNGFPFPTAHHAARQTLQWWLNLRAMWERDCKFVAEHPELDQIQPCRAQLETATSVVPWGSTSEIQARLFQECSIAEADQRAESKTSEPPEANAEWLHDAGSEPPADFYRDRWLTGTQTEIGFAIRPANQPAVKSVVALRGYLERIASAKNSRVWCRATGTKQIDAFVRDPKTLQTAEARLVTYRAAKSKKVKVTQRKSVPRKGR